MRFGELIRSRSGKVNWVPAAIVLLVAFVIYTLYAFYPMAADYFAMKNIVNRQVYEAGGRTERQIEQTITEQAKELGLDMDEFSVEVEKTKKMLNMQAVSVDGTGTSRITMRSKFLSTTSYFGIGVSKYFEVGVKDELVVEPDNY